MKMSRLSLLRRVRSGHGSIDAIGALATPFVTLYTPGVALWLRVGVRIRPWHGAWLVRASMSNVAGMHTVDDEDPPVPARECDGSWIENFDHSLTGGCDKSLHTRISGRVEPRTTTLFQKVNRRVSLPDRPCVDCSQTNQHTTSIINRHAAVIAAVSRLVVLDPSLDLLVHGSSPCTNSRYHFWFVVKSGVRRGFKHPGAVSSAVCSISRMSSNASDTVLGKLAAGQFTSHWFFTGVTSYMCTISPKVAVHFGIHVLEHASSST